VCEEKGEQLIIKAIPQLEKDMIYIQFMYDSFHIVQRPFTHKSYIDRKSEVMLPV
jgi:hypothetical protein